MAVLTGLVIDDEPMVASFLCEMLELEGVSVDSAPSTAKGIEKLNSGTYDLVITDLNQEPTGVQVYNYAKSKGVRNIYILTGGGADKLIDEAKKTAGNGLLTKPINLVVIQQIIEQAKQRKIAVNDNSSQS